MLQRSVPYVAAAWQWRPDLTGWLSVAASLRRKMGNSPHARPERRS
ncbi:MAG: hypothetical protein QOI03_1033 [Solirubrobacteraceae bacterium]|nr:hypothetical protein [Solirubrobacteraceae bacterium]